MNHREEIVMGGVRGGGENRRQPKQLWLEASRHDKTIHIWPLVSSCKSNTGYWFVANWVAIGARGTPRDAGSSRLKVVCS